MPIKGHDNHASCFATHRIGEMAVLQFAGNTCRGSDASSGAAAMDVLLDPLHESLACLVEMFQLIAIKAQLVITWLTQPSQAFMEGCLLVWCQALEFPTAVVQNKAECAR